jgi:hypothetical protein
MSRPRNLLLAIIFGFAFSTLGFSSATNVYITPNGSPQGACTTNPQTPAWFNSSANWGSGASQIGPGTAVTICGTFVGTNGSSQFTFQGSGASGNPVTLLFDTNAILTAGFWGGNGAIATNGNSNVLIDGGTPCGWINQAEVACNGVITATANGSNLANQQASVGIEVNGGSNIEIRNLSITNMFVQLINQPSAGWSQSGAMAAIDTRNGSNLFVHNNYVQDAHAGYQIEYNSGTTTNVQLYNNVSRNMCAGYTTPSGGTSPVLSGVLIHDNESLDGKNWDAADNGCHEDHFHGWAEAGGTGGTVSGMQIYNNYFHGDLGCHQNGYIYFEADLGTNSGALVYNNLLVNTSDNSGCTGPWAYPPSGYIGWKGPHCGGTTGFYNNTIVGNTTQTNQPNLGILIEGSCTGVDLRNNTIKTVGTFVVVNDAGSSLSIADHDDYFNGNLNWNWRGSGKSPLSAWQASCNCDPNSVTTDPTLSGTYTLLAGSPAIGLGANLTALGIVALNSDLRGVPRSANGSWDTGAFAFSASSASSPAPPTSLVATVH